MEEDDLCNCMGHYVVTYNFGVEVDAICDRCGGYFFTENTYDLKTFLDGRIKYARVFEKV